MAWFALAAPYIMKAGGTLLSADAQASDSRRQAVQMQRQAKEARAAAQRSAIDERRNAQLAGSRGLALAAASGAGADDPTVVNLLADIAGEGEYRAESALYDGEMTAAGLDAQSLARRQEARNTTRAGYLSAGGSILKGGTSMYERYGGGTKAAAPTSTGWVGPR